jgi:hypothetical protein
LAPACLDSNAEPGLNPYHPNHKMNVPSICRNEKKKVTKEQGLAFTIRNHNLLPESFGLMFFFRSRLA